jgi:hypothetical protein
MMRYCAAVSKMTPKGMNSLPSLTRQGTGNREQGTGNREQGTGNREQGTGNSLDAVRTSAVDFSCEFPHNLSARVKAKLVRTIAVEDRKWERHSKI